MIVSLSSYLIHFKFKHIIPALKPHLIKFRSFKTALARTRDSHIYGLAICYRRGRVAFRGEKPQCQNAPTHPLIRWPRSFFKWELITKSIILSLLRRPQIRVFCCWFFFLPLTALRKNAGKWRKNMIMAMETDGKMGPLMGGKRLLPFITENVIALSGLIENINFFLCWRGCTVGLAFKSVVRI